MTETVITLPCSGRLLVSHMSAYGLAAALDASGVDAFVGHDPVSLEMTPFVSAHCDLSKVAAAIAESARCSEDAVEADVERGKTGNDRIPVIRARATAERSAITGLSARERLLDDLEARQLRIPLALLAGLGAPAVWLRDTQSREKVTPHRGATSLDGVPYNIGSDIVRGALRHSLPAARDVTEKRLRILLDADRRSTEDPDDRLRWSPPGTRLDFVWQWLAALGLCLLPVGMHARVSAQTPAFRSSSGARADRAPSGLSLPLLVAPVSVPRLRALLQLPELINAQEATAAGRLRAHGVREVVTFPKVDASNKSMVSFSFGPALRLEL